MAISPQLVRASRVMAWLSLAGAVIVPVVTVFCFVYPDAVSAFDIRFNHVGAAALARVPLSDRLFALAFALVPSLIASWGLTSLARLFGCFRDGEVFTARTLGALANVTTALFWNVAAAFVMELPISYFLSGHGSHHEITLSLGSDDVELLFLAGVAFVIARVMAEARAAAEENAAFV